MSQPRNNRKVRRSKPTNEQVIRTNARIISRLNTPGIIYRRVMTYADRPLQTSAGGVVAATTLGASDTVRSCSDWASLQNLYAKFRVRRIRVRWFPVYRVNTAAVLVPPLIYVAPFYSGLIPGAISGYADTNGVVLASGFEPGQIAISSLTMNQDGDSHLWTPMNTAVTAAEQFGIVCIGTALTTTASIDVWRFNVDFEVEFMMKG